MRRLLLSKVRLGLLATFGLSLAMAMGVAAVPKVAPAQETANVAERSDAVIESEVTSALNASSVLKAQQITAATIEGNVTLSGNVSDGASKELAGMLALRVPGVKAVENNLNVGTQPAADTGAQVAASDGGQLPSAQDNSQYGPPNSQNLPPDMQQNGPVPMGPPSTRSPGGAGYPNGPRPPYAVGNQYPQDNRYQQNGEYAPAVPEQVSGPVQIPSGTLLKVRLSELLDARRAQQGTMFEATAAGDVYSGSVLAIPRGATFEGQVVDVRTPKGSLGGSQSVTVKLNSLQLDGRSYMLDTDVWSSSGPGKGGYTAGNTVTGAAVGAIIGGIAGGGLGAGIGAAAGGTTGAIGSAASSGPRLLLPPEAVLTFHLANALTVQPVSRQEAQRLASLAPNGPSLQRRRAYSPYGYYPGYPPPPVAYGYPYGYYYPRYRGYYYGGYYGR